MTVPSPVDPASLPRGDGQLPSAAAKKASIASLMHREGAAAPAGQPEGSSRSRERRSSRKSRIPSRSVSPTNQGAGVLFRISKEATIESICVGDLRSILSSSPASIGASAAALLSPPLHAMHSSPALSDDTTSAGSNGEAASCALEKSYEASPNVSSTSSSSSSSTASAVRTISVSGRPLPELSKDYGFAYASRERLAYAASADHQLAALEGAAAAGRMGRHHDMSFSPTSSDHEYREELVINSTNRYGSSSGSLHGNSKQARLQRQQAQARAGGTGQAGGAAPLPSGKGASGAPASQAGGGQQPTQKGGRGRKPSHANTPRVCISCGATKTPYWREAWASDVLLCNACGLRFSKFRRRCIDCCYVPRKEDKGSKACTKCSGPWS